jgi:hypothetical protein
MPPDLEPIYCVAALLAFVLVDVFAMIIWRRFQPREEFTSEESEALRRQGNVFGCGIMSIWLLGGLSWGVSQLVPGSTETLKLLVQGAFFIVTIGIGIYLGISAIKDRITIFRWREGWLWGRRQHLRGEDAEMTGAQLLIVIGAVLLIVWVIITAK